MARSYTDAEKEYIKKNLIAQAESCMKQYGMKKTTVDEITTRCRIAKGSFYHFYDSKELLFWDVIMKWHEEINKSTYETMVSMGAVTVDSLTELITNCYLMCFKLGLGSILVSGEMEDLIPKLPKELFMENQQTDMDFMSGMMKMIPGGDKLDMSLYTGAFSGIFLMLVYREQLGDRFNEILKLTIRGVVIQMMDEIAK